MGKKLAIKGHPTRGNEVIKLLKMMGGKGSESFHCSDLNRFYYISHECICWDYISPEEIDEYHIFTLEEFLSEYPFKVGDFVRIPEYESEVRICKMKWTSFSDIDYLVYRNDDEEWYTAYELLQYNDNPNKTRDCKKCGLHFGSVRCFGKDCPHNTPKPKSYAVGLKDGEVIECGINKETDMNKIKPIFKAGDVVKLKGCPDKNIFWIVMDVVKDGYIFNDGEKCSFDDQHHYEKTNREVINTQPSKMKNVLAELLEHIKNASKEELEKEFNELEEWSNVGPTVEEFMTFCECVNKKPKYPDNYDECVIIAKNIHGYGIHINVPAYGELMESFVKLLICRDAYWKIAGEEMGLDKPWEPQFENCSIPHYCIFINHRGEVRNDCFYGSRCLLAFSTAEMRDIFYENFKDLIEQCKELL